MSEEETKLEIVDNRAFLVEDEYDEEAVNAALVELVPLWVENRIHYEQRKRQLQDYGLHGVSGRAIDHMVKQIIEQKKAREALPPPPQLEPSDELIFIAKRKSTLWRDDARIGFGSFERDGHLEHHKVEGQDYQDWLADEYGKEHQVEIDGKMHPIYPKQADMKEAVYQIRASAKRGDEKAPAIRVMDHHGALWIDRGDDAWSGFLVSPDRWEIRDYLTPPFIRGDGMKALPLPERGGSILELEPFLRPQDEEEFVLFCGNLGITLNPFGSYTTTILAGPPGSGKSTRTKIHRLFTDPNRIAMRTLLRSSDKETARDLYHGAERTHLIALENVSEIPPALSDAICALNTGTGYGERKYREQGIEYSINVKRPVLINGIPADLAERSDLVDRSVTFVFDHLGDASSSDDMLWRKLDLVAPKIMGAVLDGLVGAMRVRHQFGGDNDAAARALFPGYHPRFVDAVVWGEAFCQAVGFAPDAFVDAYRNNQLRGLRYIADTDPVAVGVRKLMARQPYWQGYPAELHTALRPFAPVGLPEASWLARRSLPRVIPVLSKLYRIEIVMNKRLEQNDNQNGIRIKKL